MDKRIVTMLGSVGAGAAAVALGIRSVKKAFRKKDLETWDDLFDSEALHLELIYQIPEKKDRDYCMRRYLEYVQRAYSAESLWERRKLLKEANAFMVDVVMLHYLSETPVSRYLPRQGSYQARKKAEELYPSSKDMDQRLKDVCTAKAKSLYSGEKLENVKEQLEYELLRIKDQGSAGAFLYLREQFLMAKVADAPRICKGTLGSSLVAFLCGFTSRCPLESEVPLYAKFCFGLYGERLPEFSFTFPREVAERLTSYTERDAFPISLFPCDDWEESALQDPRMKDILTAIKPETTQDYVKCYGLYYSHDVWENCGKELLLSGKLGKEELISCREDVYEHLMTYGIGNDTAYLIADYVRLGNIKEKGGFGDEWGLLLRKHGVPEVWVEYLGKVGYLFPRAHLVELFEMDRKKTDFH